MAAKKSEKKTAKESVALDPSTPAAVAAPRARKAAPKAKSVEVLAAPLEVAVPVVVSVDAIRARAHAIHLAEGGLALDNWLRAERELTVGQ